MSWKEVQNVESKGLADKIAKELRERQDEMEECNHETVEKKEDEDDWFCTECGARFVRAVFGGNYKLNVTAEMEEVDDK